MSDLPDYYLSGGYPCSEMFARLDGKRDPKRYVLRRPDSLQGRGRVRVHVVEGWWVNKSLGEVDRWMWELGYIEASGGEVVWRNEREIGHIRDEQHPWTSVNPYLIEREEKALRELRRIEGKRQRQDALELMYMLAYIKYHDYVSAARLADATGARLDI